MSFCYEPICIYPRISGFGENFADCRYVFYKSMDSSRVWNILYMVRKESLPKTPKAERSCGKSL